MYLNLSGLLIFRIRSEVMYVREHGSFRRENTHGTTQLIFSLLFFRSVTNYFVVNLSVADLLVTIICMPVAVSQAKSIVWSHGELMCKLSSYLQGKYFRPVKRLPEIDRPRCMRSRPSILSLSPRVFLRFCRFYKKKKRDRNGDRPLFFIARCSYIFSLSAITSHFHIL